MGEMEGDFNVKMGHRWGNKVGRRSKRRFGSFEWMDSYLLVLLTDIPVQKN